MSTSSSGGSREYGGEKIGRRSEFPARGRCLVDQGAGFCRPIAGRDQRRLPGGLRCVSVSDREQPVGLDATNGAAGRDIGCGLRGKNLPLAFVATEIALFERPLTVRGLMYRDGELQIAKLGDKRRATRYRFAWTGERQP